MTSQPTVVTQICEHELAALVPEKFDTAVLALTTESAPWLTTALSEQLAETLGRSLATQALDAAVLDETARTARVQAISQSLAGVGFRYVLVLSDTCFCGVDFGKVQRSLWENDLDASVLLYAVSEAALEKGAAGACALVAAMAEDIRASVLCRR